ncbi:MAG TPA: site-specific integrase, partial [Candidatus Eisenbacteria bacterium]|nr:site-specific integrase [Candidatus Eisenbacteria bacterium]
MERWIVDFLHYMREQRRASKGTLRAYHDDLTRFALFARARLKRETRVPEDLTPELLAAFAAARSLEKARRKNRPVSARTLGRALAAL